MFQKETLPVSFGEGYSNIRNAFRALKNTLVFLVQQKTEKDELYKDELDKYYGEFIFLHTDSNGKILLRKKMKSTYLLDVSVEMISPK